MSRVASASAVRRPWLGPRQVPQPGTRAAGPSAPRPLRHGTWFRSGPPMGQSDRHPAAFALTARGPWYSRLSGLRQAALSFSIVFVMLRSWPRWRSPASRCEDPDYFTTDDQVVECWTGVAKVHFVVAKPGDSTFRSRVTSDPDSQRLTNLVLLGRNWGRRPRFSSSFRREAEKPGKVGRRSPSAMRLNPSSAR